MKTIGDEPAEVRRTGVRATPPRVVVVSNRLPVVRHEDRAGNASWQMSPGGLVSALQPILARRQGVWVGWPGVAKAETEAAFTHDGVRLHPVAITATELKNYYEGFCNRTLWPLYHDSIRPPCYRRTWWEAFVRLNRRFADATLAVTGPEDVIWVHDYQLQLVPAFLRERAPHARIGFFLHIPFPPLELLAQLPWRRQVLEGLLGADLIGFQTPGAAHNFRTAVRQWIDPRTGADGTTLAVGDRLVRTGAFPISIDFDRFEALARRRETVARAKQIRADLGHRKLVLGVDRLDYSKGIDRRLRAFGSLLARGVRDADEIALVQVAVPSRENVPAYASLRRRIERLAGNTNGRFGTPGRMPVQFMCTSLPPEELVAYYLAADVMAVTPLRDGMNLVAKEFAATRVDDTGVLVLSEFAGAADEMRDAILVNPHDHDALVDAFDLALRLPPADAARRMLRLRAQVRDRDVFAWADGFARLLEAGRQSIRVLAAVPPARPVSRAPLRVLRVETGGEAAQS